jgi:pyruvate carboxylase
VKEARRKIKRILVANRSEIAIRVFRSAHELGLQAIAIYSHEDRYALHRFQADEAYQVGVAGEPIRSYLDIEAILALAVKHDIDAIHPGYGFLSENPEFARRCREEGIIFIGPATDTLDALGDKTSARQLAEKAGVPVLGGSKKAIKTPAAGLKEAKKTGFPVMLKAAHGGGGRGMRVVHKESEFIESLEASQRESFAAFGSKDVFIENFVANARHIEVQILGDGHGNLVHLYERDCSVQRRYQKVVEIAPAPDLDPELREEICAAACAIANSANYENAGTVEFLVDADSGKFFFIEVNPRIQVEHTVTEEVTGLDLIRAQILVAQGEKLSGDAIGIKGQDSISTIGFALQCRVTTEDPTNSFMPDYGRISQYRSASGIGIRLDAGSAFVGAVVTPYYDSMLVKISARGKNFERAVLRMRRALNEFRVRGVKTNIPFLLRLLDDPVFRAGQCDTRFIDNTPSLFDFTDKPSRASRVLAYIADTVVNGNELVKDRPVSRRFDPVPLPPNVVPPDSSQRPPKGSRDIYLELGADEFSQWILKQKPLLLTDTTFRDAHQSLFATRMRTADMKNIAASYAHHCSDLFSIEMWGGATFDTSMRFLKEDPWQRLELLREQIPNILFQCLVRSSSVVGYVNYPDNVVKAFIKQSVESGMDVFRVFDALNWVPNMKVTMESVRKYGGICEASVCYTGDILNPDRTKYTLDYYIDLARQLQDMGAHILCIKDMGGLCKPEAAVLLTKALKSELDIPIHFHTHDTAGIQAAAILNAAGVKLDIADVAMAPLSGGTSQPNLNTIVESLRFGRRKTGLDTAALDSIADYWRLVRDFYTPFESETLPASADLYRHEMPGGQYTNLYEQARALGLADQWATVCETYASVNQLFGDLVKVTPTSKVVGDMALFMVANDLDIDDVMDKDRELAFPNSVVDLFKGMMGKPYQGFPRKVQQRILRGEKPLKGRPGSTLEAADFDEVIEQLKAKGRDDATIKDAIASVLYPSVFDELVTHQNNFDDTSALPTPVFFYGLRPGEEIVIDEERGQALIIKYLTMSDAHEDGRRTVFFEVNGQPREVRVADRQLASSVESHRMADPSNASHVAAAMPGMVVNVAIAVGDKVEKGQALMVLEAMKMESTLYAEKSGKVGDVYVHAGSQIETGELLALID